MKTILAVVAHADDEALGCGGTLARHTAQGDNVHLVVMADGVSSRDDKSGQERREAAMRMAGEVLGIQTQITLGLPDNAMDGIPLLDIVQKLERATRNLSPAIIYTHSASDLNVDHRLTHAAVMTAFRPLLGKPSPEIRSMEIPSSTHWNSSETNRIFAPNLYVDISSVVHVKQRALKCYHEEMRPWPHARSYEAIEALMKWRGSTVGVVAAECFVIERRVE